MPITKLRGGLQVKPDSLTSAEIKDLTITELDIAPGSLTGLVFADHSIPAIKVDLGNLAGNGLVVNGTTGALDINVNGIDLQVLADMLSITAAVTLAGNTFNGPSQLVKLDPSGNLGLGLASGTSLLDVNGAITVRDMPQPLVSSGASARMYFNSSANSVMISKNGSTYAPIFDGSNFVDLQGVTGAINGINTVFSLLSTPIAGSVHLFWNGILQIPGATNDYTISGTTITMAVAPSAGSMLVASYRKL